MKKIVSLLLVFVMVLSSFSMAFAAGDAVVVETAKSNEQMAGDFLSTAGILKGNDDGDLELDKTLTREQAMLMIARLMGKEAEALDNKLTSTFKDAKDNAYWAPVIAWAEAEKLTNGMGDGTFGLGKETNSAQVQTWYLRVLGYEANWEGTSLDAATTKTVEELGMMTAVGTTFNRGAMAIMTINTLKATPKDAKETLATTLKVDMTNVPTLVTPVEPGQLGDAKATSAKAVANDKVEVKFDKDVTVSAADFKVTEKADATKVIEVKEVKAESTKMVVLTVEGLTSGKAYTVKVGETTINFTGIAKVTVAPVVKAVKGTDFNRVEIEFEKTVDKATAEDVANYVIEKATVVKATLSADRKVVTLETEGLVKNTLYKMTIENVKSVDMVAMKKVTKSFRAIEDTIAPKVSVVNVRNNETITIQFNKEMDKTSLTDVANYTIPNLEVLSATASKTVKDNDTVTLKTSTQDVKVTYTLTVQNVIDAAVKKNVVTKFTRTFRGYAVDTTAPVALKATGVHNTLVKLEVTEMNLLDEASVLDVANYVFDRDLEVVSVALEEDTNEYGNNTKVLLITTGAQKAGTSYRLTVKGIMDEYGNALKALSGTSYRQYGFVGQGVDTTAPSITSVKSLGLNKLEVTFSEDVLKATAQDPTNYVLNNDLGAATKATLSSTNSKLVTLETSTQVAGKTNTLTINGVQDKYAGNSMVDVTAKFITLAEEADTTKPVLAYVYAPNNQELHMAFSEAVVNTNQTVNAIVGTTATQIPLTAVDSINDGTVLVFKATATQFLNGTEYTLTNAALTVADKSGNVFDFGAEGTVKFTGTSTANTAPTTELANIEQTAANKFKVTFDKNVITNAAITVTNATVNSVFHDGTNRNVLIITTNVITAGKELTFNFKDVVQDMFGNKAVVEAIKFNTYIAAPEKPVMINAMAVNNKTVELTFTEDLATSGVYELYYLGTDGTTKTVVPQTASIKTDVDNTVVLTLAASTTLKGEEVYYVKYASAPQNINSGYADTKVDPMSFQGTDVEPNANYISGVVFTGSNAITVKDSNTVALAITKIERLKADGTVEGSLTFTQDATTKLATLAAGGYFNTGINYQVTATLDGTATTFKFAGNREVGSDAAAVVAADAAALTIGAIVNGVNTQSAITANLTLPTPTLASGSAVAWASSNVAALAANGTVGSVTTNTAVTLTATITSGTAMAVNTFDLIVSANAPAAPLATDATLAKKADVTANVYTITTANTNEWSIDGGTNWTQGTAGAQDVTIPLAGATVTLRVKAAGPMFASPATIVKTYAPQAAAPALTVTKKAGSVVTEYEINTAATNEWSIDDGTTWTAGTGAAQDVTIVVGGDTVLLRVKATADVLASANATKVYAPQAAAPAVTLDEGTPATAAFVGATVAMEFTLDGGTTWSDITAGHAAGTTTVDASGAANIQVRVKATDDVLASAATANLNS